MFDGRQVVSNIREVTYDQQFDEDLALFSGDFFRADEFVCGAEWVLCRTPEAGQRLTESVWFLPLASAPGFPEAAIYYSFDEHSLTMHSIKATAALQTDEACVDPPPKG